MTKSVIASLLFAVVAVEVMVPVSVAAVFFDLSVSVQIALGVSFGLMVFALDLSFQRALCSQIFEPGLNPGVLGWIHSRLAKSTHWDFRGEQKEGLLPPPYSVVDLVRRGIGGQLSGIVCIEVPGALSPPGDPHPNNARFCSPPKKAKGAPLYDRKAISSLDETTRSRSSNKGIHLVSRFCRAVEKTWLFTARATDQINAYAALSGAVAVAEGGLL